MARWAGAEPRWAVSLEDTAVISLGTLAPGDAATLLAQLAARPGIRATDAAIAEITRLCGHAPWPPVRPDQRIGERDAAVFAGPTPLLAGAAAVGEPLAVLSVLFGMLWRGELAADLDTCRLSRFSADSQARMGASSPSDARRNSALSSASLFEESQPVRPCGRRHACGSAGR
jgi:hypothetical protein